jgi:diguanylate cyclase (GGDEF)-like protein
VSTQRYRRKDGNWIWVEVNFNLTYDSGGGHATGYVAAARDISARKEAEFQIAHMARHDALTDLANRTLFRERLVQELGMSHRRGANFAVLCLDLDRFKFVNDTLGHQAGDALLCAVAGRLRGLVRAEDTVARIGGDEFMIIQTGPLVAGSIRTLAQRLIEVVSQPIKLEGGAVTVGVSIGVAVAPQDGTDPDLLCRNADLALFQAKDAGRNTFRLYEPGMRFGPA